MRLFGLNITRANAAVEKLSPPDNSRGGWQSIIREFYPGSWQRNEQLAVDECTAFYAVFACHTLICSDIAKLRVKLVRKNGDVWQETVNPAFSPVIRKPNPFQTRGQFWENWINSKLARGNTYVLKRRDGRNVVTALYVLNPDRVQPLVSDDGQVFYRLSKDNLASLQDDDVIVPAREIIHDRYNCLFHPLVGISPLYAAALAATVGTNIQRASSRLFANGIRPSGIISAPGRIDDTNASRIKEVWESKYAGADGASRIAVLGDGLKFEALTMKAEEAELIAQLKYTAEQVCAVYHIPGYKIGAGQMPAYSNVQSLNVEYYSQALQRLIEDAEVCLDEGLGIGEGVPIGFEQAIIGTEFDTENLLRMDTQGQITALKDGVQSGIFAPNEARARVGLAGVAGGDAPFLQQQNWPIDKLADREPPEAKPSEQMPAPTNDDDEEPIDG